MAKNHFIKKTFLKRLAKELGQQFGDNFSVKNLHECAQFYRSFPEMEIVNACVHHLTWAHFRCLMRVEEERARLWYLMKAVQEHWSAVALNKNIESQIFDVLEPPPDKAAVVCALMQAAQGERQSTPGLFKSPALGQFLGFRNEGSRGEKDLRSAMVSGIRDALLETGRDFAFVGKEVPIETENGVEVMDLVFYQIRIKGYVLLNLKMGKIAPEDRRKIERCVRQYDQLKRARTESPTLGILLSSESCEEMAGFYVCHDNSRLGISRYLTFLPTKERLEMEIERQKSIFYDGIHLEKKKDEI